MFIVTAVKDLKINGILNNIYKQHAQSANLEKKMLGDCICEPSDRICRMFALPPKPCHRSWIPPCLAVSATAFLQTCLQILFGVKTCFPGHCHHGLDLTVSLNWSSAFCCVSAGKQWYPWAGDALSEIVFSDESFQLQLYINNMNGK